MAIKVFIFALLNFAALGIGAFLMNGGPNTQWYIALNKAPWTPPGWVFGAAWFTIMLCFSFYMAKAWTTTENLQTLILLFSIQWILNVSWNPVFFKYHEVLYGLIIISLLAILIGFIFFHYIHSLKSWSILILPYLIWLLIATSLNAYIYLKN